MRLPFAEHLRAVIVERSPRPIGSYLVNISESGIDTATIDDPYSFATVYEATFRAVVTEDSKAMREEAVQDIARAVYGPIDDAIRDVMVKIRSGSVTLDDVRKELRDISDVMRTGGE